jgi:Spy/CpxP family protein refolding chaperone
MDALTRAQRREAAERLTAVLDLIAAGEIDSSAIEAAYIAGTADGLEARREPRPA